MQIADCPVCGKGLNYDGALGDIVSCPHCEFEFVATKPTSRKIPKRRSSSLITNLYARLRTFLDEDIWPIRWALAAGTGGFFFLLTINTGPMVSLLHYPGLFLGAYGSSYLLFQRYQFRFAKWFAAVTVALAVLVWYPFDIYEKRHEEGTRLTIDSHQRFALIPYYRTIIFRDEAGSTMYEGPFSDSGKKHGKWHYFGGTYIEDTYFWYGEEITEGEWHLRNK